jgi:glycosyltransferase involved in cell wall biosynthesis
MRHIIQFHHPMSRRKLQLIKALGLQHRWNLALVPSSAEARAFSAALGLPPGRVRVLNPSPIDLDFFAPSRGRPRAESRPHVLSAGLSHRDYPCLLRALRTIPHVRCDLRAGSAWTAGQGSLDGEEVPPNVQLRPFVRPHVLRDCYSAARFVVVPIRPTTQWSAGCTTVLHAQAMGKAVIASAVPGLHDFLEHGKTGLLVPPDDPEALARAINELWSDPERAAEMGRRAGVGRVGLLARPLARHGLDRDGRRGSGRPGPGSSRLAPGTGSRGGSPTLARRPGRNIVRSRLAPGRRQAGRPASARAARRTASGDCPRRS